MKKSWNILKKYLSHEKVQLVAMLLFALFYVLCSVLIPYFVGLSIDIIGDYITDQSSDYGRLVIYIFVILFLIVIGAICQYFFDAMCDLTVERITKEMKDECFVKINKLPISYIDQRLHGDILSVLVNDIDNVNTALISFFKQFLEGFLTIIITIVFMFYVNWMLALVVLILSPLSFYISFFVASRSNKYYKKQVSISGKVTGIAVEDFNNIELLQSFNYEDEAYENFKANNHDYYNAGQKAQLYSSFTNPSTRLINNIVYAVVGLAGACLCIYSYPSYELLGASCTIGVLSTFLQYANQFAKPFNEMSSTISEIQQGYQSLNKVKDLLEAEEDKETSLDSFKNPVKTLDFSKIMFSYDEKNLVINDVSFHIEKGQKIAVVGPTGSGKTTLINLLLRFYEPNFGSIDINDEDIRKYSKKSLRNKIGLVLQDSWIFEGTIFENITFCKDDATLEEVIEASKKANSYDFIAHLPKGFDTVVNSDSGLSEGEKQLICITRLMLLNPEIVILDEATSNIDSRSEVKIVNAFNELMENKTSIVIAHRLSTIRNSDLILVLKNGEIVESGNHETLLAKNGFYTQLYNAQFSNQ